MITLILGIKMGAVITLVLAMVAVAFFTLIERKVLGYIHIRKGPNKPGPAGLLVPFADAVKLFLKEIRYPLLSNKTLFNAVCILIIIVPILLWIGFPLSAAHSAHKILVIYILAVARVGVYGTLGAGWRRNRKYSMLGAIRAVAQTISYEVRMTVIVLRAVIFIFLDLSQDKQIVVITWILSIFLMFTVRVLAEANRSPFDFAEGERELVRGFNTEYRSVLFVMVFLAEYISIIFISALCGMLFMASEFFELVVMSLIIGFFYIWSRGTLPRFRYDQLIYLAWKCFLPISLVLLALVTALFSRGKALKAINKNAKHIIYEGLWKSFCCSSSNLSRSFFYYI